jgi:hypothetical protein
LAQTVLQQRVFPPTAKQITPNILPRQPVAYTIDFDFYINNRVQFHYTETSHLEPTLRPRAYFNSSSDCVDLRQSAMYSSSNRAQGVFGFFTTVAAFVAGFAALSVFLHPATDVTSSVDLKGVQVYVLCNHTL